MTFFSCGYGRIPHSHVEIEFGKNSKAKHIHAEKSIPPSHLVQLGVIPAKSIKILPGRADSLLI